MSDDIQNIKIKYIVDDSDLTKADKSLQNLSNDQQDLTKQIKATDTASKQATDNIQTGAKQSSAAVDNTSKSFQGLTAQAKNLVSNLPGASSVQQILDLGKATTATATSTGGLSTAFNVLKIAIAGTGIGLLVIALISLIQYFRETEEGGDAMAKALQVVGAVMTEVNKILIPLAQTVISLGQILLGTGQLLFGYTEGLENIKNGANGVVEGVGEAAGAVEGFGERVTQAAADAALLADALDDLEERALKNAIANAGLELTVEQLIIQSKNRTKAEGERIELLEQANSLEDQIAAKNKEAAAAALQFQLQELAMKAENNSANKAAILQFTLIVDQYKVGIATIDELSTAQQNFANKFVASGQATVEALKPVLSKVKDLQAAIEESQSVTERNQNRIDLLRQQEADKRDKAAKDAEKARQDAYNGQLKAIDQEQAIAVRRAKLNDDSQSHILLIESSYNDKRIVLLNKFGKQATSDYESDQLKKLELVKAYDLQVQKEAEDQAKKLEALQKQTVTDGLATADLEFKQQQTVAKNNENIKIQNIQQLYQQGIITRKSYEEQLAGITYAAQQKSIQGEIAVDEDKLQIVALSEQQRADIESDLVNKKKALYDLDFQQFQKAEADKLKVAQDQKNKRQAIEQSAAQSAQQILTGLAALNKQNNDNELTELQQKQAAELAAVGDNKQAQAIINKKFLAEENAVKTKQAQQDKDIALFNIALSTAQAVIRQLAATPLPLGAPIVALVAATGVAQLAFAAAKPLPKFNKGTKGVPGIDQGGDSIMAMLRPGEGVMPVNEMKDYKPAFDAIFDRKVPAELINSFVLDYGKISKSMGTKESSGNSDKYLKEISKKLDNIKTAEVTLDRKGIRTFLKEGATETEIENGYLNI